MRAVIDTSSLISLAWSGRLDLIAAQPLDLVVIEGVFAEAVVHGRASGHADAIAIERAIEGAERAGNPTDGTVDESVVMAAGEVGVVITNDQVVGRRSQNLGARWLRTADLVVLAYRTGNWRADQATAAIAALHSAGRITHHLKADYIEELA